MIPEKAILKGLGLASATFPNFPTTREMVEAYGALLGDLEASEEQFVAAVARVLKTSPFFPTVHAIRNELIAHSFLVAPNKSQALKEVVGAVTRRREAIDKLGKFPSGSDEFNDYRASAGFREACDPSWSHSAIRETIETLGGWNAVFAILKEGEGSSTFRSQFWKIYADYAEAKNRLVFLGNTTNRKELE